MITLRPVGVFQRNRSELQDDGWDRVPASTELNADVADEELIDLEDFSPVEIIFHFDRIPESAIELGALHPRGNPNWPRVGIVARRAKKPEPPRCDGRVHTRARRADVADRGVGCHRWNARAGHQAGHGGISATRRVSPTGMGDGVDARALLGRPGRADADDRCQSIRGRAKSRDCSECVRRCRRLAFHRGVDPRVAVVVMVGRLVAGNILHPTEGPRAPVTPRWSALESTIDVVIARA